MIYNNKLKYLLNFNFLGYRFKLHLLIMDQTGESKCLLFDSFVKEMIGLTAAELLQGDFDEVIFIKSSHWFNNKIYYICYLFGELW